MLIKAFGWQLQGLLSMGGSKPSSKSIPGKGLFSPRAPQDFYTTICTLGPAVSSPGTQATPPLWGKSSTSKTSSWATEAVCKKITGTHSTSHSPVFGPDRFFSCANSMLHFPIYSHSLSFVSPQKGSLPSASLLFSLPQFTSTHLELAKLCPSNCGDPSATPQIYFLAVPSYLTLIQLCLRIENTQSPVTSPPS